MLKTVALMLEHGLGRPGEARRVERAVDAALREAPTPDQGGTATTSEFGDAVVRALASA
jgi:3-isopropylmalate dehydrogenase